MVQKSSIENLMNDVKVRKLSAVKRLDNLYEEAKTAIVITGEYRTYCSYLIPLRKTNSFSKFVKLKEHYT